MGDDSLDCYSSTRYFHIGNALVRTMIGSRLDGWSRIGNFLLWCTHVRTTAVRRLDGHIWIAIFALRRLASGRDTTSSERLIDLPFLGTWKEIRNWSSTDRRPDMLLKRPDGCKLAHKLLNTVWGSDGWNSGQMGVRTGWLYRLDGRQWTWILRTSRLWIVESLFTAYLHLSDFVQTQNEAKILTHP
jgi:hypothetical protein